VPARIQAASGVSAIGFLKWRVTINFRCRYLDFTTAAILKRQEHFGFTVDTFVECIRNDNYFASSGQADTGVCPYMCLFA
jgi:hypothetical protein